MAEFRLDGLTDYSEAGILSELARVAALVPGPRLTIAQFARHARVSPNTLRRRFGGWKEALEAAGLGRRCAGRSLGGRIRGKRPARGMTDAEILAALRAHAERLGRGRLTRADLAGHPLFCAETVRRRFGGWRQAMERAGLEPGRWAVKCSDAECFANLRAVWTRLSRAPRRDEMCRPPSRIGAGPYRRRWGTWRRALEAFAERANAELRASEPDRAGPAGTAAEANGEATGGAKGAVKCQLPGENLGRASAQRDAGTRFDTAGTQPGSAGPESAGTEPAGTDSAADSAAAPAANIAAAQGPRHVPVSLRFKIMQRDGFRCTACGNSPAIDRRCRLEIDHVVPWSKGGPTEPANLRTLCSVCNAGKGDALPESPLPPGWNRRAVPG
jgi:hypothetical protein